MASPIDYFKDLEERGVPDVNYVGELYYQCHRGTYTSQAKTKRGNRKSEVALREAEMWASAAGMLGNFKFPRAEMDEAWRKVLVNQFHDILPGSSIKRVYQDAEATYAEVIETAGAVARSAAASLAPEAAHSLTVFNSLSWERRALVELPADWSGASADGEPLPVQPIEGRTYAELALPPCGWATMTASEGLETTNNLVAEPGQLENEVLRVKFDRLGRITSIYDKEAQRELADGVCNKFAMYKDVPTGWDAWDIDSMYPLTPVELAEEAEVELVARGPLIAVLRIRRKLHGSTMTQHVSLRRSSRRVEFETIIDWQESHKLLKTNFPVAYHANEGIHEIQFGHIRRPNHKSRPFDADRFEVCNHKWTAIAEENCGFAVLNDCKYGVNVDGNSVNLTLLKSAKAPDMSADKGMQEFTYAFYAWNGSLAESNIVREACEVNVPVMTAEGAGGRRSLLCVDAPNVVVETVKPAEDGSRDIVVRLYESKRMATRCKLTTSLPVTAAVQTDMLEQEVGMLELTGGQVLLEFRPFEVKTVRMLANASDGKGSV